MLLKQRATGTFSSFDKMEVALHELKDRGFLMNRVSIVGRDINSHTEMTGSNTSNQLADVGNLVSHENRSEETAVEGAITGGALGAVTGLLVGMGLLAIPGIGPVMLAGATATAIASTISASTIGALTGGLVGGLVGLGIPEDRAKIYSDRVAKNEYLVIIEGSPAEITQAKSILNNRGIHEWYVYDLPDELMSDEPMPIATSAPTNHSGL